MSAKIDVNFKTTVREVIDSLASIPPDAKVTIYKDQYYNQFDTGSSYISITWTEER